MTDELYQFLLFGLITAILCIIAWYLGYTDGYAVGLWEKENEDANG